MEATEVEIMDKFQWVNEIPGKQLCTNIVQILQQGTFTSFGNAFTIFWGAPNQPGSLCNLREIARCTPVDKGMKVFNTGDEFLLHAFKAAVASSLTINTNSEVDVQPTKEWLYEKAEAVATKCLMPLIGDPLNSSRCLFYVPGFKRSNPVGGWP